VGGMLGREGKRGNHQIEGQRAGGKRRVRGHGLP